MAGLMQEQFSGLDMSELIGGPLRAVCNAQAMLAASTIKFIQDVGFEEPTEASEGARKIRTFSFSRPVLGSDGDNIGQETIEMSVPLSSVVKLPTIEADNIHISFDMEVKSSEVREGENDKNSSVYATNGPGIESIKARVNIKGPIMRHEDNRRDSDNTAKYHVEVRAKEDVTPEKLSKIMEILTSEGTLKSE